MRKRVQHAPAHELNLDKKAQRMVEEVRLKNIEREHRSVGAVLDTRTLVPLVAPRLRQGALNRAEQEKRRSERRDAAETSTAVMEKSQAAIRAMTRKGETIVSVDNFENEELIWTTKTKDSNYSQDRKYYHKDLQHFKDHMTAEQRRDFKLQTHERLVELATKYRAEMSRMKEEMDLAGVFHPDANAHRAHCMYLMKLYKGIRADTIEDPVLRKLRDEEQSQKRAAEEEERKQRELIESIENKNKGTIKVAAGAALPPPAPAPAPAPAPPLADAAAGKKTKRVSVSEKMTATAGGEGVTTASAAALLRKSKSLPSLAPKATTAKSVKGSSSTKSLSLHLVTTVPGEMHESGDKESGPEHNGEGGGAEEEGGGLAPGADNKLFTKIKRGKLGGADPKTILLEEAARLEKSDVLDVKKTRERSSLVDSEMTTWMLSLLQKNQIEKTAQGRDVVPTTIDLFASASASLQTAGTDEAGSAIYSPDKASALRDDINSSTRMVPFAEFYDMFRQYSAEAKDRKEKEEEKELKRQEKEAKRLARLHQHHDHHHHEDEDDDLHSPNHSRSKMRGNASGEGEIVDGVHADHLVDNEASSFIGALDAASVVNTHHQAGGGEPMLHEYLQEATGPKKTNLVQVMKETDPQFDAYYKTMLRQKPQGARLFKGTVTKVPKLRVVAPLGKSAVVITDTRGKEKAVSSKGFYNVFTTRLAMDETTVESSQITLETQKTDEDDKSVEVVAATNFPGASPPGSRARDEEQPHHQQQQQQRSRTPSPSNARRSRNRSRGKKPGAAEQSTGESAATVVLDFQTKLVCVWDCLQLPAQHRLQFMRKYASKAYAAELSRAIDLWAECAVLILARINMVDHNLVKVREGYAVLPLRARDLLDPLMESLPEAMTSTAQALFFQATESSPLSTPLSVLALDELRKVVEASFPSSSSSTDVQTGRTQPEAEEQLQRLGVHIEGMIVKTATHLSEELNDTVTFAGLDYREWLAKLKAPQVSR